MNKENCKKIEFNRDLYKVAEQRLNTIVKVAELLDDSQDHNVRVSVQVHCKSDNCIHAKEFWAGVDELVLFMDDMIHGIKKVMAELDEELEAL